MKKLIFVLISALTTWAASAQTYYQLPSTHDLIGYQCPTAVQFVVTGDDGTTQTGLVFAQCSQGGGRGGNIWHNAACAAASWDEVGNLLSYEATKTQSSRAWIPTSWCFGT